MGWSIFPKLLRNQSQSTGRIIIPLINKPIFCHPPPLPSPTAATRAPSPYSTPPSDSQTTASQIHSSAPDQTEDWSFNHSHSSHPYFPSFSFGIFINPKFSTGLMVNDVDGCASEDSWTIWADSVKKKRKRKMNKHKLRKLRKRLRKKT